MAGMPPLTGGCRAAFNAPGPNHSFHLPRSDPKTWLPSGLLPLLTRCVRDFRQGT